MPGAIHLNLDDAWEERPLGLQCVDARQWGPRVRYFAPRKLLDSFSKEILAPLPPFVLYGSGDFHHLAGLLCRKIDQPFTLISFDNHPDWDIRPPRWACGGWINRALELPQVQQAQVWGCGNFELNWPSRLFANRRALRQGRLVIHAWAQRFGPRVQRRFNCMTRENWKDRFNRAANELAGKTIYITIDIDCLTESDAATNWENGLFTPEDIAWAINHLRQRSNIIAGDLCGALSPPLLARWTQRLASRWDHPTLSTPSDVRLRNHKSLNIIWPALTATSN